MPKKGKTMKNGVYCRGNGKLTNWWLDCRINGTRYQFPLGKGVSRSVAAELAQVKRAAILRGEVGIGKQKKDITFTKAAELFLVWARANKRPNTVRSYGGSAGRLTEFFGSRKLSEISPFLIEKYKLKHIGAGKRRKADGKVLVNRDTATLTNIFNRCLDWGKCEGPNPVLKVKRFKESKGRVRFLTEDEERDLLNAAKEPMRTMILVGIYSGARLASEALTLTWPNVDFKNGFLTILDAYAKNGETRTIPLEEGLREALLVLKEKATSQHVFEKSDGKPYRFIRTSFDTACRNAKLAQVTPHTLRHTFGSRLGMAGVDARTIQELGGWKNMAMVERYTHLSPDHKVAAIRKLRNKVPDIFTTQAELREDIKLEAV
ncbi:MAG: site-specific integrase [Acidobacteria bacterium]|nr:MAG: site-specific integrase [Acidobacteriota bacterium]